MQCGEVPLGFECPALAGSSCWSIRRDRVAFRLGLGEKKTAFPIGATDWRLARGRRSVEPNRPVTQSGWCVQSSPLGKGLKGHRMDYVVELDFEGPGFVAVPNSVVDDQEVSADALAVLVYLARLAGGRGSRIVRVSAVRDRFGWGKERWQRVSRELRSVGALVDNFGRSDDGRNVVRSLSVGWPKAKAKRETCGTGKPAHRSATCGTGNPAHRAGNPAQVGRVARPLKREHTKTAAAPAAPHRAKPEAAALSEPGNAREGEAAARVGAVAFAENVQGEVEADALEGWGETAICALQFGLAARVGGRWLRPDDPLYGAALVAWHEREAARALA